MTLALGLKEFTNVRCWLEADFGWAEIYVCFTPESGRREGGRCTSANDPQRSFTFKVINRRIDFVYSEECAHRFVSAGTRSGERNHFIRIWK